METSNRMLCHQKIVSIDQISFAYENKTVINNLQFDVFERDFVGVIGSNGAGKTTLLKMLVGLLKPTSGEIRLFDRPLNQFKEWERIGYVPQKNAFNPLFPATVREVVLSGMYTKKNVYRRLSKADLQKAEDAMLAMRIEDLADRRIGQLSGGQQQRAFLARAIVNNPELLILDEPTVGIDAETQIGFFRMIKHMHQHHHMTFIMVSHDMDMIQSYLGTEPQQVSGGIKFYVKHTHDPEDCRETNLTHSLGQIREMIGVQ
ncbi:Vitamin B12 import ATP-binding protein BtuD [Paenibacillus allorhizoplanae]|uniref:Vitamin B12 import ATP-binding protein BtuD n=1 Tax=Paenibacillus allorhizoplanae TaxID=2905648 RepID=A0ABM9C0E4_9BACL|nr:metal ABC transporter ATP-binding protein [Paenibacillus allorhizoplanae]CAH1197527.1 Vitamin B12 import ATP-binding protein BtuD [Paenibacillus allorhizoplanae]